MKVTELKAELKKLGLKITGSKSELVARLEEFSKQLALDKETTLNNDEENSTTTTTTTTSTESKAEETTDKAEGKTHSITDGVDNKRKADEDNDEDQAGPSKKAKIDPKQVLAVGGESILDYLTEPGWKEALAGEFTKSYFQNILKHLETEKQLKNQVFPPAPEIFSAFNFTPLGQVKVVILGQDPYHDDHQAHGLCFSVRKGIDPPPSLKNMYKELKADIPSFNVPKHGSLEKWATQGVLLLNASLTVQAHQANSHSQIGWLEFTDAAIQVLNKKTSGVVFILWGKFAQKKGKHIDKKKHHILEAAHPSPLSASKFFGCKVFSKTNALLTKLGKEPIDWNVD